ncbi:MAG: dicarboxylate/amino acid:cation symporter, partial [Spirochaetaceae bacterium]|nr:dicarboxylate/amino acid:cation symporter [Spirochaetaceae bacterium]
MSAEKTKKGLSLTTWILIGTIGGIVFGSLVGPWAANLKFIGDIFIRLIQMSVVLLVMTSVAAAVGNVNGTGTGKMGFHTFKWIIAFTIVSAFLGLVLAFVIKPGEGITISEAADISGPAAVGSLQETLLGFVPTNVINAMSAGSMVPCILFAIFFGVSMGMYTRASKKTIVLEVVEGINGVVMNIIKIVMNLAPIGIFCLLANVSGAIGFRVVIPMAKFLGALLIGDIIQFLLYGPL